MIKDLSQITIDNPEAMNSVLNALNSVLQGGNNHSSIDGNLPTSTVGNEIFIVGDIRPGYLQRHHSTYMLSDGDKVGIDGDYSSNMEVSSTPGSNQKSLLSTKKYTYRLENTVEVIATSIPPTTGYRIQLWNASAISYTTQKQEQTNTSITAWVPITDALLVMEESVDVLEAMVLGLTYRGKSLSFKVEFEGTEYLAKYNNGSVKLMGVTNDTMMVFYSAARSVSTADGRLSDELDNILNELVIIESVDRSSLSKTTWPELSLIPFENSSLGAVVTFEDMTALPITPMLDVLNTTVLTVASGEFDSMESLENGLTMQPVPIHVSGTVKMSNGMDVTLKDSVLQGSVHYLTIKENDLTLTIEDAKWELSSPSSKVFMIKVISGRYNHNYKKNIRTILYLDNDPVIVEGGKLFRNQTDGYVIKGGKISGYTASASSGQSQSLINQETQELVLNILESTTDYMRENGTYMSSEQMQETAENVLNVVSSVIESVKSTLNKPLWSDLQKNLNSEKENYDSIFNVIPDDIGPKLQTQGRKMAAQIQEAMSVLEDTFANRAINNGEIPYSNTVKFPESISDLGVDNLTGTNDYRLGMWCYEENPFMVNNTHKTINITGEAATYPGLGVDTMATEFESYQILDIHTFQTVAWNVSLFLEIRPTSTVNLTGRDAYVFLAYQRLPGPIEHDHDHMMRIKYPHDTNFMYVPGTVLRNQTGLFYIGIGVVDNSGKNCVEFPPPSGVMTGNYCFMQNIRFDVYARALTKGCYHYDSSRDRFINVHDVVGPYHGDVIVQCLTNHLSTFSLGLFTPDVDIDFSFEYVNEHREQNITSSMIVIVMTVHMLFVMILVMDCEMREVDKGDLYNMADNSKADLYHYVVATETGYRMCAGTDSKVYITLYGTEADEMARELSTNHIAKNSSLFNWGTTPRFLLRTPWSLGDIRYIRIWVDNSGRGNRESWFCNRVFIKDLHTGSIYRFPIHDWLGQCMGDGASERLSPAEEKVSAMYDSMSIHILAETISYIAMYTGGGLRTRRRISRCSHAASILVGQYVVCLVNWAICSAEDFVGYNDYQNTLFGYKFSARDVIYAILLAVIILPFTSLLPYMKSNIPSYEEVVEMDLAKRRNPNVEKSSRNIYQIYFCEFKLSRSAAQTTRNISMLPSCWPSWLREVLQLLLTWVLILLFICSVSAACSLAEDDSVAFTRRYFIALFLWIIVTEPIKGVVLAFFILKWYPSHFLTCELDEAILPLSCASNLQPAPECMRNDLVGTTESDLRQLQDNKDKKTSEELFFETTRGVAALLAAQVIIMGLLFYYRDSNAFHYQREIKSLLNLEASSHSSLAFESINQIDQFWEWARKSLAPALLASWYDGGPAWAMRGFANDMVSRAMGIGHIRQIRTLPMSHCDTEPQLAQYFTNCSADISSSNEDHTSQYAASWTPYVEIQGKEPLEEYRYKSAEELQSTPAEGLLHVYPGGGYTVLLKGAPIDIILNLDRLQRENWIDMNTRAIFVELSMYNAQVNYFSVIQLMIEIPAEGYLLPSAWVESVRLIKYQGKDADIIIFFEFAYLALVFFYFLRNSFIYITNVVNTIKSHPPIKRKTHLVLYILLGRFWDFIDFLVGILGICSIIAFFLRQQYIDQALENFAANNGNAYINLSTQRNMELMFTFCVAGVAFFISCKMIKILRFNRRIAILADTLNYAGVSIIDFAVVFFLIFFAFNVTLYCLLWDKLQSYKSAIATFETTTAGMLGKFVVADMFRISMLASIIFMMFMYTGTLFLINIFVMIVLFEFEQVRNDSSRQTNEYELIDHIQTKLLHSVGMYGRENLPACYVPDTLKDCKHLEILTAKTELLLHRVHRWRIDDQNENIVLAPPRAQDIAPMLSF
ncbi:hypothetical protein RB195_002551 [Necator americanus]|uniref:PLAT domain-containing protein n=1 Tax=Necator americanus TaxID=51031 RepID=A0ABR1DJU8_NECAM